jgi:hypothetical protein
MYFYFGALMYFRSGVDMPTSSMAITRFASVRARAKPIEIEVIGPDSSVECFLSLRRLN